MALMSPPILVANATAVSFRFAQRQATVNVQVRFFTDAAGLTELLPIGTGSRDVTATNATSAFEGEFANPGTTLTGIVSDIDSGTLLGMVDGTWYEFDFGSGMNNVILSAAANVTPGGALSYRIIVDTAGSSGLA